MPFACVMGSTFFPFLFGLYPYIYGTEKQRAATERAGVKDVFMSIHELTRNGARKPLGD